MGLDLLDIFKNMILDPDEIRCVIVTGAGDRAFCAGGDLKERQGMSDQHWRRQHAIFEQAFYAVIDCPIPVIAAVNGAAYGGGCELALCCDFIYAAAEARFAFPETSLGIIPGGGGTQNLARAVGSRRARELIFSASPFSASDALEWGMINAICAKDRLLTDVMTTAERISRNAPLAVQQAKRSISIGAETDLKTGLAIEIEAYNRTIPTADRREGSDAFREKRPPRFQGR
jgi:enoyl-CoA hydratase/carnithine racemase